MSDCEQIIFQCNHCDYNSIVKSNLTRHKKKKHPEESVDNVKSLEKINEILEKKEKKSEYNNTENGIDIDDFINQKINHLLKSHDLPPIKVEKDIMKSIFSGSIPSFFAGSITGYILSQILPTFFFSIKNQALKSIVPKLHPMAVSQSSATPSTELPTEPLA
jgi:hypothetical protein